MLGLWPSFPCYHPALLKVSDSSPGSSNACTSCSRRRRRCPRCCPWAWGGSIRQGDRHHPVSGRRSRRRQLADVRPDLRRPSLQPLDADQRADDRQARSRVEPRTRHDTRARGHAARRERRDLHHRFVERVSTRSMRRPATCAGRTIPACPRTRALLHLLRRRQSRRRALSRQGLRRHARRPADCARRAVGKACVERADRRPGASRTRSPAIRGSPKAW